MVKKPLSMGEVFRRDFPTFLVYGMTAEQYWNGDPWLVVSYAEAYRMRVEEKNWELWLQGFYNHEAFAVVLANAFSNKGSTPKKYQTKPLDIFPKTEEQRAAEEELELRKTIAQLNAWEKAWSKQHANDQEEPK